MQLSHRSPPQHKRSAAANLPTVPLLTPPGFVEERAFHVCFLKVSVFHSSATILSQPGSPARRPQLSSLMKTPAVKLALSGRVGPRRKVERSRCSALPVAVHQGLDFEEVCQAGPLLS